MILFASLVVQVNLGIVIAVNVTATPFPGAALAVRRVLRKPCRRLYILIRSIPIESADSVSQATRWLFDPHRSL